MSLKESISSVLIGYSIKNINRKDFEVCFGNKNGESVIKKIVECIVDYYKRQKLLVEITDFGIVIKDNQLKRLKYSISIMVFIDGVVFLFNE